MTYSINGEPGYIIRCVVAGVDTVTYSIENELGEAIRTGEMLLRESNATSYWIVDRKDGEILWERL